MAFIDASKFSLYRWRYIIGYGAVGLTLAALLVFAGLFLPGGLSEAERQSVIATNSLSFTDLTSFAVMNLPYRLLQAASLEIFGIYDFSIKLPSLILALLSALGLIFLLRRWFTHNVAVIGSFIAITTGQFLFVAQNGTASILYIFWPTLLLLLGTLITRTRKRRFFWKILFFITAALSLYTPLSIYPLIAILLVTFLHPHLRSVIRNLSKPQVIAGLTTSALIVVPLIYGIIQTPTLGLTLLGIPTERPDLSENMIALLKQYLDFWNPSTTTVMTPVFGLGSLLLIAFGLYRLVRTRETTQSYLIICWLICLVPILVINPDFTTVMFIPLVLLLTNGLEGLIRYWYRLFPRNPYARIAGLVPLVFLVGALVVSGLDRYAYGYYYQPGTVANFSRDLSLLPKDAELLVVSKDEQAFYEAVGRYREGLSVTPVSKLPESTDSFVATRAAHNESELINNDTPTYRITRIVTSASSNASDRFYLYERVSTPEQG